MAWGPDHDRPRGPFAAASWHLPAPGDGAALRRPAAAAASAPASTAPRCAAGPPDAAGRAPRNAGVSAGGPARFSFFRRGGRLGAGAGAGAAAWLAGPGAARAGPRWPLRPAPRAPPPAVPAEDKRTRVLILMSDTGGGHRASAEALRAGFAQLYGERKFRVDVVDLWTAHTPWPFNQLPNSYSFLVRYPMLWRANFTATHPRAVHEPLARLAAAWVGGQIAEAYAHYAPDLIVSVHPLMQHVPVRVLRSRVRAGLQARRVVGARGAVLRQFAAPRPSSPPSPHL